MIYLIRGITALALFAYLAKANIHLGATSQSTLAFGYRAFLLASPLLISLFGRFGLSAALIAASAGSALIAFTHRGDGLELIAAMMIALGLSVGGYLVKAEAAETAEGAAWNKIALNVGSLLSGIYLLWPDSNIRMFWLAGSIGLGICSLWSIYMTMRRKRETNTQNFITYFNDVKDRPSVHLVWMLFGVAIGIKFFSVLALLPQFILKTHTSLPWWFSALFMANSIGVVLAQMPIMKALKRMPHVNAHRLTLTLMAIGLSSLCLTPFFSTTTPYIWGVWIILMTLVECAVSYLDVSASKHAALLTKEASVGLGAAITVILSRDNCDMASYTLAALGVGAVAFATLLEKKRVAVPALTVK